VFDPDPILRRRLARCVPFAAWLAVSGVGRWLHADPQGHGTHRQLGLPPCPSALMLGRPCPGCGLTTSWTAFLHGDLATAFRAHPLGPFAYLAFTGFAFVGLACAVRGVRLVYDRRRENLLFAAALVFLAFGLFRMATTTGYRGDTEYGYAATGR
jgi:hypothetical protein